jgi:hypothetical protein
MTARQPAGVPVGGQFAATAHAEPGIELAPAKPTHTAPLTGTVELHRDWFEALPEWPEEMPEPEINFGFDDGKVETYVTVDGQMMTFWDSDQDGTICDSSNGQSPWEDFDLEDQEKAEAWGKAVHERIDSATYGVMIEGSHSPAVKNIILAHALDGGPVEAAGQDLSGEAARNAYLVDAERRLGDARREVQQVYMIGAAQEMRQQFPEIASFSLAVGGKSLEIADACNGEGELVPNEMADAASYQVFRYRAEDDFSTFIDGQVIDVEEAIRFRPVS